MGTDGAEPALVHVVDVRHQAFVGHADDTGTDGKNANCTAHAHAFAERYSAWASANAGANAGAKMVHVSGIHMHLSDAADEADRRAEQQPFHEAPKGPG